jgi:phosphoserine phosphatase
LIAKEGLADILPELTRRFEIDLGRVGRLKSVDWIEPDLSVDLSFDPADDFSVGGCARLPGALIEFRQKLALDFVVQPSEHRHKRLLVADMDSTMITVECIDELADYAGLKAEVAAITERAMQGELDFVAALDARVRLLKGMPAETIDRCREERVRITPGAKALVRTMKARGATCILVSGGFTRFAEPVAQEIGFDRVVANVLEIEGGLLTGEVRRPIVGAATKRQVLLNAAAEFGIPLEATMAVGDGANDIPMLEAAGLGIAYHAKPAAREAADAVIDHADLSALLYVQNIPRAHWACDAGA